MREVETERRWKEGGQRIKVTQMSTKEKQIAADLLILTGLFVGDYTGFLRVRRKG